VGEQTPTDTVESSDEPVVVLESAIDSSSRSADAPAPRARFVADAAAIIVVWSVGAAVFFRSAWSGGFYKLLGDSHDTVLITYLQEHWFQVLHGHVAWQNPAMFYPIKGVLGWSDGYFLFQIFYIPLRLLGFDMFLAAQLTIVLFTLVGFASFVCLARVVFGAQRWIALIGGLAFTFANNLWLHVYWPQLLGVWMVPGILLVGVLAFRASAEHPVRSLALGGAFGLLVALTFFTSFYVAWFSTLAAAVTCLILLFAGRREAVRKLVTRVRDSGRLVLVMGLTFAVGLVPFLVVYLPAQSQVTHVSYRSIMKAAPRPRDLLNVGTENALWTSVVHHLIPSLSYWSALTYAVTPLLMAFAVIGSAAALWTSRKEGGRAAITAKWAAVLAATAVVLLILPVRTQWGSLWAVVWHVPGATAIRRTNRLAVVTDFVASLALVCAATELYRASGARNHRTMWRTAVVVLVLFAAVEQFNTTPMAELDRAAELAFLRSSTAPQSGCRSFYVVDSQHTYLKPTTENGTAAYFVAVTDQIDAMLISEKYSIPTLNGYTGYPPKGWGLLYPFASGYLASVRSWAKAHHVQTGLCQLDLGAMRWQTEPAPARPLQ
jgi:hypothetical protein